MSASTDCLVKSIVASLPLQTKPRIIVIIAGPPGSGKSTVAQGLADYLATIPGQTAVAISMDGFHYSRKELQEFPDAHDALIRRGAPFTFNLDALIAFANQLRLWVDGQSSTTIYAPSFDHAIKDPVPDAVKIPDAGVVIFEGNYLLLDEPGWRDLAPIANHRVFISVDPQVALARLIARHQSAGIVDSEEDARWRAINIDGKNAELIMKKKLTPSIDQELCSS